MKKEKELKNKHLYKKVLVKNVHKNKKNRVICEIKHLALFFV